MKTIGYYLFAFVYNICRLFPVKKKKVLCIMTHDDGEAGNVSLVMKALKRKSDGYTFAFITKHETSAAKSFSGILTLVSFFILKPYELATAKYVLMDNIFLPYAYIKRRKGVKIIQLWHGTGTIKKFGQDFNTGKLKELEKRANDNITHLIVNSDEMKQLYHSAFGVPEKKIYPIGLPKTDELLNRMKKLKENQGNQDREYIYRKYKIPADKKLVLYAPTFRDEEVNNPKVDKHLKDLMEGLPEDYYLGIRLHPFVARAYKKGYLDDRIIDLSFEADLNTVLMASDILISDYSSIIFEYCVTERPMIFYAYDYESFSDHGRGFYRDYHTYVPGPVVYRASEAAGIIKKNNFDEDIVRDFKYANYTYLDGNATNRLIKLMEDNK